MARKKRRIKKQIKIILYVFILLMVFSVFALEILIGKKILKNSDVTYSKESTLNYITYLKDNTHYENTYLKDEFNLVANLVDYFNIDYNYTYTLGEKIDYELTYSVDAVLEIYDSDNDVKPIEKKKYTLLKEQKKTGKSQIIKVDIIDQVIEYDTYDAVVQAWKKEISPNANLKVLITVNWIGHSEKVKHEFSDNCTSEFSIPISKKTIDVKAPTNINESGVIKISKKLSKGFMLVVGLTLATLLAGFIYLLAFISNINNKSKYEQKVSKILREFDRAITEAKGQFVMQEGESYIEVKDFMELLDVHDNVNEPIIYYVNSENLSVFVIKSGSDTYFTTLSRNDYDD